MNGAGILFICTEDSSCFLLLRSNIVSESGTWCVPGGGIELGEGAWKAAQREVREEAGSLPGFLNIIDKKQYKGDIFTTFICDVGLDEKAKWKPKLNKESTDFGWFSLSELPDNLHYGFKHTLNQMRGT